MKTANDAYREAGIVRTIALDGVHLFSKIHADPAADKGEKRIWFSPKRSLAVENVAEAIKVHDEVLANHRNGGGMTRDLGSRFGYVTDAKTGAVTHWISPNGRLWAMTYLGRSGQPVATSPLILPA